MFNFTLQRRFENQSHHVASPKRPHSSLIECYYIFYCHTPKSACLINSKNLIPEEFLLLI